MISALESSQDNSQDNSPQNSPQNIIYCANPDCENQLNFVGDTICANCQTPLIYRYIWATSSLKHITSGIVTPGTKVADRYEVISQQIWLDTEPGKIPEIPTKLPVQVIPYLKLFPQRLHISQAYGFIHDVEQGGNEILLLENIPVDETGKLYPAISESWEQATPVRQVYWLWQILQLWTPLLELGVAQSLLLTENIRVQGWCIKLIELYQKTEQFNLSDLGRFWQPLVEVAKAPIAQELESIVQQMLIAPGDLDSIMTRLNQLLLASAADLPLIVNMAGATDIGTVLKQNEDNCYPCQVDELDEAAQLHLAIVCDGIGGHEGGEVASQLAVQSLKLQIRALLAEIVQQTEIIPPDMLQKQLTASLRVVNNIIWSRNDIQKRQGKERMATTMVMALQLPQKVMTISGWLSDNAHELYLANIGDSRAYWITRQYCQLLTVDDDLTARAVRVARSLYRQAIHQPNAHALTQALGTKEAEFLHFSLKRLILEEDGVLLLCSDGLSDGNWVEQSWRDYVIPLLAGEITVDAAVRDWIKLVNEKQAQDNISLVLTLYKTSPVSLVPVISSSLAIQDLTAGELTVTSLEELEVVSLDTEITSLAEEIPAEPLAESSQTLLELGDFADSYVTSTPTNRGKLMVLFGGILIFLIGSTSLGLGIWWQFSPQSFQQMCRQLPQKIQHLCPR
jgi:protein phosphatase